MTVEYVVTALALVAYEHTVCVRLDGTVLVLSIIAVLVVHIHRGRRVEGNPQRIAGGAGEA